MNRGRPMLQPLLVTDGRKLRLLQTYDPFKQWWTLDEMRFCTACDHLFLGRDVRLHEDENGVVYFRCPSFGCDGEFAEWQYPQLHL